MSKFTLLAQWLTILEIAKDPKEYLFIEKYLLDIFKYLLDINVY